MTDRVTAWAGFFRELTQRRVVQAVVVYAGAAFLLLEAVGNLVDALRLPESVTFITALLVVLGFPVAVVLAWVYQWTPDGLKKAETVGRSRAFWLGTAAALLFTTGLTGFGVARWLDQPGDREVALRQAPPVEQRGPVLAVLPFENAGDGADLSGLASLLEAQVETVLAGTPLLTLRWRRAIRPLLANGLTVDSIARRLDVDYLIQAELSQVADVTRVVVQLVDARTMTVVESARLEQQSVSSLALLDALTARIEDILRPTVGHQVRLRRWRAETPDSIAFRLLWQARERWDAALAPSTAGVGIPLSGAEAVSRELAAADSILALAARRDPQWREPLLARARLAADQAVALVTAGSAQAVPALFDRGLRCVDRALDLAPDDPGALALRARLLWRRARLLPHESGAAPAVDAAERDLRHALALDPDNAEAAVTLSELLYVARGQWDEAYHYGERAYRLDAYHENWNQIVNYVAMSAFQIGDDEAAVHWCREGLRRDAESPFHNACALEVMAWGDATPDPAAAWRHHEVIARHNPGIYYYGFAVAAVLARADQQDSARAVLEYARASAASTPAARWLEAAVRFRLGDHDVARDLFRNLAADDPDLAARQATRRPLRDFLEQDGPFRRLAR
jgi:TolB-like protein/tetratricopeptide (TPR) repeat protein